MLRYIFYIIFIITYILEAQCVDKYTDENRPYEFGFKIGGEQHRHEKKDENGLIMGEFGFITADGVYHVTVYATDENGNFKILSMKNIRVKPYPTSPQREGHSLPIPPSQTKPQTAGPIAQRPSTNVIRPPPAVPALSCSHCSLPTTTTKKPELSDIAIVSKDKPSTQLIPPGVASPQYPQTSQGNPTQTGPSIVGLNYPQSNSLNGGSVNSYPQSESAANYPQSESGGNNLHAEANPNHPDGGANSNYPGSGPISNFPQGGPNSNNQGSAPGANYQGGSNTNYPGSRSDFNQPQGGSNSNYPGSGRNGNYPQGESNYPDSGPSAESPRSGLNTNSPQFVSGGNNPQTGLGPNNPKNIEGGFGSGYQGPGANDNRDYPQQAQGQQSTNPASANNERNPKQLTNSRQNPSGDQVNATPGQYGQQGLQGGKKPTLISAQMQIVDKNTDIHQKQPGERDGLPDGLSKDDMLQLLYTFNYTVGFHGHHEEGYTNGAKKGYYFITGRNGIRTRVDYVADENGFRPKITEEVLDVLSDHVPKPETEKDEKYGLKGYEFKWLYYPAEKST